MKYYSIDKSALASLTVAPHDISCVLVPAGTRMHDAETRKVSAVEADVYIIADYVRDDGTDVYVRRVRQALPAGRGIVQRWMSPSPKARAWCRENGMPRVTVRGQLYPIVGESEVAIPDYGMCGTTWFVVPISCLTQEMLDDCRDSWQSHRGLNEVIPQEFDGEYVPAYSC